MPTLIDLNPFAGVALWGIAAISLIALCAFFIKGAVDIWRRTDEDSEADSHLVERKVFKFSLLYLFVHFGMLLVELTLTRFGMGGW